MHVVGHDWGSTIADVIDRRSTNIDSVTLVAVPANFLVALVLNPAQVQWIHVCVAMLCNSVCTYAGAAVVVHVVLSIADSAEAVAATRRR